MTQQDQAIAQAPTPPQTEQEDLFALGEPVMAASRKGFLGAMEEMAALPPEIPAHMTKRGEELMEQAALLAEQIKEFERYQIALVQGETATALAYAQAFMDSDMARAKKSFGEAREHFQTAKTNLVGASQNLANHPFIKGAQAKGENLAERMARGAEILGNLDLILLDAAGSLLDKVEQKGQKFYAGLRDSYVSFQETLHGKVNAFGRALKTGVNVTAAAIDTFEGVVNAAEDKLRPIVSRAFDRALDGAAALGQSFRANYENRKNQDRQTAGETAVEPVATAQAPKV